jgi:uncharacterized membrane protein
MFKFFKRISPRHFLNRSERRKLVLRTSEFYKKTGCEIFFHFRRTLGPDPLHANRGLFSRFKLHRSDEHNILVTLALVDRRVSVWAGEKVAVHTGDKLWNGMIEAIVSELKAEKHLQALLDACDVAEKLLLGFSEPEKAKT